MNILTKIYYELLKRRNPIKYAKTIGVTVGKNCRLMGSPNWGSEPWLISVGDNTLISFECAFITHDGATWTFRREEEFKDIVRFGKIEIGNDCFIGARSIILPNVKIGDKSVVAAGAVVTKSIPDGEVWGGVPAHFITTTEKFAERCKKENPVYDKDEFKKNPKKEITKICEQMEKLRK